MNTELQEEIEEARQTYIGRIILLVGSAVFFIGNVIATIVAYQTYHHLLNTTPAN